MPKAKKAVDQVYPDLPNSYDEPGEKVEATPDAAATIKALEEKIAALQRSNDETRRAQMAMLSQPVADVRPPEPQFGEAPNPAEDPQGYAKWVDAKVEARERHKQEVDSWAARQQASRSERLNSVWGDFSTRYEDLASNTEQVGIAAENVLKKARAKGIDTEGYMFRNSNVFVDDVANEMKRLWPNLTQKNDEDDEDDDDIRTMGLPGGNEGRGRATEGMKMPKLGSLSEDISALKKKFGISEY